MFAKPFRVKSNTQMKGSDKKKLKAEVRKKFPDFFSASTDANAVDPIDEVITPKDDITVSKVYTFSGESYFVYYQSKNPIFFEPEKEKGHLHPTVYTLWKCPNLLPAVTTHPPVLEKLTNGADLMLPGIVVNHKLGIKAYLNGKIKKGDILAVNLTSNLAPVAIGSAFHSSEDMYMAGHRGKGLVILHCLGDQLWASGTKTLIPDLGPPQGLDFLDKSSSDEEQEGEKEEAENPGSPEPEDGSEEEEGEQNPDDEDEIADSLSQVKLEGEESQEGGDDHDVDEQAEATDENPPTEEVPPEDDMDELLENAFLRACKVSAKKIELPILSSNFYRVHIVTSCPPGKSIDLKKSSYKKLSKFLSKMQSEGIITVSEPKKGVETISNINHLHSKLENFRVIKYAENPSASEQAKNTDSYEPPVVTELRLVSGDVSKFFKACGYSKGDGLTLSQVRECVKDFVEKKNLQNQADPKLVNLSDPLLAEAVLVKGEEGKVTALSWEKVSSRIMSKMSQGFSLTFKGFPPTIHKGKLELIELSVGTRSGNKKVTLVHNLDIFSIDLQEFAHKCQVGVAASTTIHEAPNKRRAGGLPVMEVLIQGNQVAFVGKLLVETYKIPKKYIKGLELAAKPKKEK